MKKTLIITATALMLCVGANAQEDGQRQRRERPDEATMLKERTDRMAKEYGLDEAQTAKLLELNQKYAGKMGPMMGGPGGPGMGRPPRDAQKDEQATEDNTTKSSKKAKKSKKAKTTDNADTNSGENVQQGGGRPGGMPRMTEEQMKEMRANREAYEAELKGIMTEKQFETYQNNMKRGPQGRGPGGPRGGFRQTED